MNTLTQAWEQQTVEDCSSSSNNSTKLKADEKQRSSRRRISSSLAPWAKQATVDEATTSINPPGQHQQESSSSNAEGVEQSSPSSLLTRLADADDDDSKKQNNVKDDVEQELQSSSDLVVKYHYTGDESSDNGSNNRGRRYSRISMIIIYGREALCILALLLTTYASIQNSPPRISKAPPPAPFFSKGSLVHDWPTGALGPTQTRVSQSELSFVFYYAPWCAESQHARSVYEHVARLYYREAHFAAINCWQPGGECRLQYSKVQSWPVLMAYQPNGMAVQFHQAWTNAALSRFVQSLINPIQRMVGPGDLMSFMTGKDAVVVAFIDVNVNRKQYNRFYQTSLKWLEKDPFQEVAFGAVTGESSSAFGVEEVPAIRLYLWNETIEFPGNDSWTMPELTNWINKQIQVVSMWIAPPGATKSSSLAPYFNQGPVLFFFTPRSLYGSSSDAYMMLRQLGMQYYNCRNDIWVQEMAKKYIAEQRRVSADVYSQLSKECELMLKRHPSQEDENRSGAEGDCRASSKSAIAVSFVNVLNSSKFGEARKKSDGFCDIEQVKCDERFYECGDIEESMELGASESCGKRKRSHLYGSMKHDGREGKPATSMLDSDQDYRGPKLLKRLSLRRQCELLRLSEEDNSEVFFQEPTGPENVYVDLVKGMSCKFNKTLTFLGMDSDLYHAFAERLGVDVLHEPNKSIAIIVDPEDESTYLLRKQVNLSSMAKLVHDFYNGTYPRFLRSNNVSFKTTHSFNMSEFRKEHRRMIDVKRSEMVTKLQKDGGEKQNASRNEIKTERKPPEEARPSGEPQVQHHRHHFVREINSHNFNHVVVNCNKTVVVHFYSAQCAFCSVLSQHLLIISKMLQQQPLLEFVRIDGDRNDLRWEYTMDSFPTLIIFPNQRKSESRVFSRSLPITVPNVLGFILSNLNPPERLYATTLICNDMKPNSPSRDDCLGAMKRELSDNISLNLRLYRLASKRPTWAARILRRLQALQEFYLATLRCLSHSCDFNQLKSSAKNIHTMWQIAT
ncbi:thioredoxin domain-containing protein 11-like [Ochlerotatus camptorhynchus]|uniref:thioredoxin domain-containing protein 11-like n=1 Tax=Ochlerotatus camptorhynchus TaxID=644619 RepID=UPI0031D1C3AE